MLYLILLLALQTSAGIWKYETSCAVVGRFPERKLVCDANGIIYFGSMLFDPSGVDKKISASYDIYLGAVLTLIGEPRVSHNYKTQRDAHGDLCSRVKEAWQKFCIEKPELSQTLKAYVLLPEGDKKKENLSFFEISEDQPVPSDNRRTSFAPWAQTFEPLGGVSSLDISGVFGSIPGALPVALPPAASNPIPADSLLASNFSLSTNFSSTYVSVGTMTEELLLPAALTSIGAVVEKLSPTLADIGAVVEKLSPTLVDIGTAIQELPAKAAAKISSVVDLLDAELNEISDKFDELSKFLNGDKENSKSVVKDLAGQIIDNVLPTLASDASKDTIMQAMKKGIESFVGQEGFATGVEAFGVALSVALASTGVGIPAAIITQLAAPIFSMCCNVAIKALKEKKPESTTPSIGKNVKAIAAGASASSSVARLARRSSMGALRSAVVSPREGSLESSGRRLSASTTMAQIARRSSLRSIQDGADQNLLGVSTLFAALFKESKVTVGESEMRNFLDELAPVLSTLSNGIRMVSSNLPSPGNSTPPVRTPKATDLQTLTSSFVSPQLLSRVEAAAGATVTSFAMKLGERLSPIPSALNPSGLSSPVPDISPTLKTLLPSALALFDSPSKDFVSQSIKTALSNAGISLADELILRGSDQLISMLRDHGSVSPAEK